MATPGMAADVRVSPAANTVVGIGRRVAGIDGHGGGVQIDNPDFTDAGAEIDGQLAVQVVSGGWKSDSISTTTSGAPVAARWFQDLPSLVGHVQQIRLVGVEQVNVYRRKARTELSLFGGLPPAAPFDGTFLPKKTDAAGFAPDISTISPLMSW